MTESEEYDDDEYDFDEEVEVPSTKLNPLGNSTDPALLKRPLGLQPTSSPQRPISPNQRSLSPRQSSSPFGAKAGTRRGGAAAPLPPGAPGPGDRGQAPAPPIPSDQAPPPPPPTSAAPPRPDEETPRKPLRIGSGFFSFFFFFFFLFFSFFFLFFFLFFLFFLRLLRVGSLFGRDFLFIYE